MVGEWPKLSLEALKAEVEGSIAIGPFGSRMKADRYTPTGVPVIRGNNLSDTRSFSDEFVYVSPETADELWNCNVRAGDLVFPHRGAIGEVGIVPQDGAERYVLSTSLMKFTCNRSLVDPFFLFYFFRSPAGRYELLKNASTVGTPGIGQPLASLKSIEVPLPTLQEQQRIAGVLSAFDDKIELNRRMNETMEGMVRALFKSWFVDFDPARAKAEGLNYRLPNPLADVFPNSFEASELGEIPSGWSVGRFGDVAENPRRGVSPNEIQPTTPYIALEHMPRKSIALSDWGTAEGIESGKFVFFTGEILFGKLRPYFHKVGVAPVDGVCSTDILVVGPHSDDWFGFVLGHVSSDAFVQHTNAGSTGTKMPRTSWGDMARYPIVLPPEPLAKAFTERVRPLISRILTSIHQNRSLTGLRDALLPRLISGDIRVPDAERTIGEQM
jgi:type I restriction enzyme S subunit